jgi:hypothetical protein
MRAFALAALLFFACPFAYLFLRISQTLVRARQQPSPAAIMFTPGTARQWLEDEQGRRIRAVLKHGAEQTESSAD